MRHHRDAGRAAVVPAKQAPGARRGRPWPTAFVPAGVARPEPYEELGASLAQPESVSGPWSPTRLCRATSDRRLVLTARPITPFAASNAQRQPVTGWNRPVSLPVIDWSPPHS